MSFNEDKWYILHKTKKRRRVINTYLMNGIRLQSQTHNPYLGVELQDDLKWDTHITNATSKENKCPGFLRRNLARCPERVKEQAYNAIVRPHLEYASSALDPFLKKDISRIEAVQRRALRFVTNNYDRSSGTVTELYRRLSWDMLEKMRTIQRLCMFQKITYGYTYVALPSYLYARTIETRSATRSRFTNLSTSCDVYKYSFLPRKVREWNSLPTELVIIGDTQYLFKQKLTEVLA